MKCENCIYMSTCLYSGERENCPLRRKCIRCGNSIEYIVLKEYPETTLCTKCLLKDNEARNEE